MPSWASKVRKLGEISSVRARRHQVHRDPGRRPARNEIGLVPLVLKDQPEEVPTQAQVNRQLGSYLPVVIDVSTVVVLSIVR